MLKKIKKFLKQEGKVEAFEEEIIELLGYKCTVEEIQKYLKDVENFEISVNSLAHFLRSRNLRKSAATHIREKDKK